MVSFTAYCVLLCIVHILHFFSTYGLGSPGCSPVSTPLNPPMCALVQYSVTRTKNFSTRAPRTRTHSSAGSRTGPAYAGTRNPPGLTRPAQDYCLYVKACWTGESNHGCPQKFFQGGQRRHFAYLFQVAHVAMQMDVHKTLYCFYTQWWSLETWSRYRDLSRLSRPIFTSLGLEGFRSRHSLEVYKSREFEYSK